MILWIMLAVMLAFDLQNSIAYLKSAVALSSDSSSDYTLIVPMFGNPDVLTNKDFLKKYKSNVLLVLDQDTQRMVDFSDQAEAEGWRVLRVHHGDHKVSRLVQAGALAATTNYCIRFDADTISMDDPGRAVRALEKAKGDWASVKTYVRDPKGLCGNLQNTEYKMSMQARHFRPWMTSGACMLGRTSAMRQILANHTHWWNGEDIECGVIAKHYRMKVVHVDYTVYTEAPATWYALFKQRRMWWAGNVRQSFMNFEQVLWFPAYIFYNMMLIYVGIALRGPFLYGTWPQWAITMPLILALYVLITTVANWKVRTWWFLIFPLYSFLQVCIMPPIGLLQYVRLAVKHRSLGRYRIRWWREKWIHSTVLS